MPLPQLDISAERRALALEILKARNNDATRHYKPGKTQEACHRSQCQYRLLSGTNRSGKSTSMGMEIKWALEGTHPYRPNFAGGNYLLITTRRQQADLVWRKKLILDSELRDAPRNIGMIPMSRIKKLGYSTGDGIQALKSLEMNPEYGGARLYAIWSGDINSWTGIEGIQFDGVFIDENSVRSKLLEELAVRIRDSYDDPEKPGAGFIFWAATETKVEEAFTRMKEVCQDPTDHESAYFNIPPHEAIAVTEQSEERASKLMSKDSRQSRLHGGKGAMDFVRIYPNFERDIHCIKGEFEHQPWDNVVVGYDPGMAHATGMVVATIRRDDPETLHFWACFNKTRQTIEQECDWLKEQVGYRQICRFIYDPSARAQQKAASGLNIAQVLHQNLEQRQLLHAEALFRYGQNSHALGIRRVREMIDKFQVLVYTDMEGCELLARQLIMYRGRPETNYTGVHGIVKKDDDLCFVADTPVLMADGGEKRIADIIPGDLVDTPLGPRPVLNVFDNGTKDVCTVSFSTGREATCTPDHEFATMGWWKEAFRLTPADILFSKESAEADTVDAHIVSRAIAGPQPVYDIEVAEAHCFYASGILVSNCDPARYLCAERIHWVNYGRNYGDETTEPLPEDQQYVQQRVEYHQKRTLKRLGRSRRVI